MRRGQGIRGGSAFRLLLTMLMLAGIVLCNAVVYPVRPAQASQDGSADAVKDISRLAVGGYHSLRLRSDGTLWAWGYNNRGQLGLGDTVARNSPTQVGSAANWLAVAAGADHSLGLRSDGTLWAWGYNTFGRLGLGDTTTRYVPTQVGSATNWVAVAAGVGHSLGLRCDGTLWAWGYNEWGQLGLGDTTDRWSPTQVGSATNWMALASGSYFSLGLRSDGTFWAWGRNNYGQLGLGDTTDRTGPTQVGTDSNWVAVTAGGWHSLGLRCDSTLWAWGSNNYGQLGLGDTTDRTSPTQVGTDSNWVAVDAAGVLTLGLRSDGTLWAWGNNLYGQLGLGDTSNRTSPTQVGDSHRWVAASAGGLHSLGLRSDGTLWAWGRNNYGQLGIGDYLDRLTPTSVNLTLTSLAVSTLPATGISASAATLNGEVTALGNLGFAAVVAANAHTLGLCCDGSLWAWGYNQWGQLGLGDTDNRTTPTQVGSATNWVALAAGEWHSLGLRSTGTLWAWGYNEDGELGLGHTTNRLSPTQVGTDTNWVAVDGGLGWSVGLRSDGTLWAWGYNADGQLGLGDTANRLNPTQVDTNTNWVAVSAGKSHSLGLQCDGTLWAWGQNDHGQLGLGDTTNRTSPTQVGGIDNCVAVSAGLFHSLVLRSDGTLWVWGNNWFGELGLGDTVSRTSPTQVGSDTNWVEVVAAEDHHSLALRSDGTLWSWGRNVCGELGLGDTTDRLVPTQVGGATNWVKGAAGGASLGLRSDGTLWAWGGNVYGNLGLGDTTDRLVPTQVVSIPPSCQVSFEWGPTTTYGNVTPPQTVTDVGAFSAALSGLTEGATYHYRSRATGEGGTAYGNDMTFTITGPLSSIAVIPSNPGLVVASSITFSAQGYDQYSNPLSGLTYTWSCTDSTAGSIDPSTGVFTAGTVPGVYNNVIQAVCGAVTGYASVTVSPWTSMTSDTAEDLHGVWGTSGDDVFAVGAFGTILHYDGTTWDNMTSGSGEWDLFDVWGTSGDDVFAVGAAGHILHYDGDAWTSMTSGSEADLLGVWGISSSDVFAVSGDWYHGASILHWDGSEWSNMTGEITDLIFTLAFLYDVWGSSSSDVFAVGLNPEMQTGVVMHYDGATWDIMASGCEADLFDVWGASTSDVFVVSGYCQGEASILHWNGVEWSSMANEITDPVFTSASLYGVWGISSSDVFAVGQNSELQTGVILHYDGTSWDNMTSGIPLLEAVWCSSSSDVYAVGPGDKWETGPILHYDGVTWGNMTSGIEGDLYGVWGSSSSDVFAVGAAGTIQHYDGMSWDNMTSGTGSDLHGVWGSSSSDVLVVGAAGTILHYSTSTLPPVVTTDAATGIGITWATLNGSLASRGTAASVQVSFEWGLDTGYGNTTTPQTMTSTGAFSTTILGLTSGATYHYRARAAGNGAVHGEDRTFTAAVDTTPPPVPSLVAPLNGGYSSDSTPTLDWTDVSDPSGAYYWYQVDDNSDFVSLIFGGYVVPSEYTVESPIADGVYYWRVCAADMAGNASEWTGTWSFTVDTIAPPVPALVSPTDGEYTNDGTPTLDWTDATDVTPVHYQVQVDDNADFSSPEVNRTWATSSKISPALGDGTYYWRVRAVDGASNASAWTGTLSFTVDTVAPPVPTLASPSNGRCTSDSTPTLDWTDVTDTAPVHYQAQVDNNADFLSPEVNRTWATSSRISPALGDGTCYWRVRAVDGAGNMSDWTVAWSFTVDTVTPAVPVLVYPVNGKVTKDNTPWLDWSDVTDATGVTYQLQVDDNSDFSSLVLSRTGMTASSRTLGTLADGTYYWRVRAVDGAGNASAWTAAWSFTVDTIVPPVPTLLYPTDGKVTSDTTPWLDWSDVTDATGVKYQLQVDNNADFSSPVVNKSGLTLSSRTLSTLSAGAYYWRVRAVDGAGNASAWTAAWSFTVV